MIRDINITARSSEDDDYYEPPTHVLSLAVIGGNAQLDIYRYSERSPSAPAAAAPLASINVPARSLLLALTAAVNDSQRAGTGGGRD